MKCYCSIDIDLCPVHDWSKRIQVPDRKEELRQREIRKGMRMTSNKRTKQEF